MAVFEINLIRNRTLSAGRRRAMFWGLALYLVVCIVALALMANQATRRLVAAQRLRRETSAIENQFRRRYPEAGDILSYAGTSGKQLDRLADRVEEIGKLLSERINLAGLLSGIAAPLPSDVHVMSFEIDARTKDLTFDIVVPAGPREKRVTAGRLLALWNEDKALVERTGRIRSLVTQRHQIDSNPVVVLRFACSLRGEEAS